MREVRVQGDLKQTRHISHIMPVYEFENRIKWLKLPEMACSMMATSISAALCLRFAYILMTVLFYTLLKVRDSLANSIALICDHPLLASIYIYITVKTEMLL